MTAAVEPQCRRLPAHPSSVGQARALLRETLSESPYEPLLEDAELLVSEVVTNALVHAGTPIDLVVSHEDGTVRVEVSDGATRLPVRRDYSVMDGTGRGLQLLEKLAERWGVHPANEGKTVWFELSPHAGPDGPSTAASLTEGGHPDHLLDRVTVTLRNVPLLLHAAWHQHAESVLREYLLIRLDDGDGDTIEALEAHAAAHEAIAILVENVPAPELGDHPEQLLAAATEPLVSRDRVLLPVPRASVRNFRVLEDTLEAAFELARAGELLTPPIQPEMRALRQWLCLEVAQQSAGAVATPWSTDLGASEPQAASANRDTAEVSTSQLAVIAADDRDVIVAASRSALDLLGYSRADDLVGHRLLDIIPARYHQAHLAGFTMHLNLGRSPLLNLPVTVPAVRCDGSEILVELTVTSRQSLAGGRLFIAELTEPG